MCDYGACTGGIAERGWGLWAVEELASGAFIGYVGLQIPRPDLPLSPCVEIGWRLAHAYWRRGYATEAARGALQVAFERLALPEIVSFTAVPNLRSEAVMQRLGMVADGVFEHPSLPPGHALRLHKLCRLGRAHAASSVPAPPPGSGSALSRSDIASRISRRCCAGVSSACSSERM